MVNTNYFSGIVKILDTPKEFSLNSKLQGTHFCVELPQKRKNRIISVFIWGKLSQDVQKFYKQKDYILIEGYTSFQLNPLSQSIKKSPKQMHLVVVKIYPILLNPDRTPTKI